MVDALTLALGIAVGAGAGLAAAYFAFYRRPSQPKVKVLQRTASGEVRVRTIGQDQLDSSRRELRTATLERDLLASALTRVYEAETAGQITREEREMIARRYSEQIRELEARLRDRELFVEVGELEQLRDELVSLFKDKIQNIEARLDQAKERLQPVRPEVPVARPEPVRKTVAATTAGTQIEELERVIERKAPRKEETDGEKRVRELREEVMEALARLEQIDTKKEPEKD